MRQPKLKKGDVVEEAFYSDKWHFGLINNDEGVALEKNDPKDFTQTSHLGLGCFYCGIGNLVKKMRSQNRQMRLMQPLK